MPNLGFFMIEQFFNNPWTIGIGGSVVSGIIVWLVTTKILSRGANKEYLRKLDQANNEILYSIRPSIAGGNFPSLSIINSVISATAKKYELTEKELININDISNYLIKEIMDNSFLPPDQKTKFCEELLHFKSNTEERGPQNAKMYEKKRESAYTTVLAMTMAVFTTLASLLFSLPISFNKINDIYISLFTLPLLAISVTLLGYVYAKYYKQRRKINEVKKILSEEIEKFNK